MEFSPNLAVTAAAITVKFMDGNGTVGMGKISRREVMRILTCICGHGKAETNLRVGGRYCRNNREKNLQA